MKLREAFSAAMVVCLSSQITNAADLLGSISVGTRANNFNMTTMNGGDIISVVDWAVWGIGSSTSLSPDQSKNGGTAISDLTVHNPASQPLRGLGQFSLGDTFQWSDGSPTASNSNVQTGIQVFTNVSTPSNLIGTGFSFTVAGSTTETRRLYVWVGTHSGTNTFTASLNGASTATHQLSAAPSANEYALLTYDFKPNSNSDLLTIQGLVSSASNGFANNYWFGAAVGVVPEPSTYVLGSIAAGVFAWATRKRKNLRTFVCHKNA